MRLILASGSPRRRELLARRFADFEILTSEVDETLGADIPPEKGTELLAIRKGAAVLARLEAEGRLTPDTVILSSDTLVELDGVALGKPVDEEDACRMLRALAGKRHTVRTGVAIHAGGRVYSGVDSTDVYFLPMSEKDVRDYVATGEPMDKAGAYGIQGIGGKWIAKIDGKFDTVMGLSMDLVEKLMKEAGVL